MPLIKKPEQTTLGHIFNLKDLDKKIYTDDEIRAFHLDAAIDNHPLARKPTSMRSKLAYKEILRNLRPDKKYILPGQIVLFNYSQPKFKEELEYYDNYPFCISRNTHKLNINIYTVYSVLLFFLTNKIFFLSSLATPFCFFLIILI